MKKALILSLSAIIGLVAFAGSVGAVQPDLRFDEHAANNPNVVAYYETGPHGIVGESGIYHEGEDLVMAAGQSGNFQQWFYGYSETEGIHGEHSIWNEKNPNQDCPADFILVPDAYPEWGDYLTPGADYCVKTNDFGPFDPIPGLNNI